MLTSLKPEAATSVFPGLVDRNNDFWRSPRQPDLTPAKNFDKACNRRPALARGSLACTHVREANLRSALFALIAFALVGSPVLAQDRKGVRLWNLTLNTITTFQMSPAGTDSWGPDQCKNDRDGTVDHDERLRITGIEPGRYDVKLADKIGRVCIVRKVDVRDGAVFSIEEKQLTDCRR